MNYADNQNKFVVIVRRDIAPAQLLNAVAHCCSGLVERVGVQAEFLDYPSLAGKWTARISRWPVIILTAKNANQMARFVNDASERNLAFNCFTNAMLGESAQQQQSQVAKDSSLEYWAIAAFGDASILREITRRFSLYRSN
ncbi:MAG: DUF2000 family protein [Gammaproteobacteria bacterium]|nr:DUF2000 family protein [Gammaproteobacteria bacterium]